METLEKDAIDRPVINSWRQTPTRDQIAYATDLCRSELSYAERQATIATFATLDSAAISALIDDLRGVRQRRMERLRQTARRRKRR